MVSEIQVARYHLQGEDGQHYVVLEVIQLADGQVCTLLLILPFQSCDIRAYCVAQTPDGSQQSMVQIGAGPSGLQVRLREISLPPLLAEH